MTDSPVGGAVPEPTVWEEIALGLFAIGTTVLTHRRRVASWVLGGGVSVLAFALVLPAKYTASASFMPQAADPNAGLRSLAGQFGLQVGGGLPSQSPDFYASLVESNVILSPIAADSFAAPDGPASRKQALADLLDVKGDSPEKRAEAATEALRALVDGTVDKRTGVITVKVTTRWRPVSIGIGQRIIDGLNEFNLKTRQSQASAERRFAEGRVALAQGELRASENRLQQFLERNRQTTGSPQLTFERDRMQREVSLHQQVVVTLAQALEEARLREVRDTPVITIVQPASANLRPDPGGRLMLVLLGMLAGGTVAVLSAFLAEGARRAGTGRSGDARSFRVARAAAVADMRAMFRWAQRGSSAPE